MRETGTGTEDYRYGRFAFHCAINTREFAANCCVMATDTTHRGCGRFTLHGAIDRREPAANFGVKKMQELVTNSHVMRINIADYGGGRFALCCAIKMRKPYTNSGVKEPTLCAQIMDKKRGNLLRTTRMSRERRPQYCRLGDASGLRFVAQ